MLMELNFLTIADTPEDLQPLRRLLASFEHQKHVQLSLGRVGRERVWQSLLMDANDYEQNLSAVLKG